MPGTDYVSLRLTSVHNIYALKEREREREITNEKTNKNALTIVITKMATKNTHIAKENSCII